MRDTTFLRLGAGPPWAGDGGVGSQLASPPDLRTEVSWLANGAYPLVISGEILPPHSCKPIMQWPMLSSSGFFLSPLFPSRLPRGFNPLFGAIRSEREALPKRLIGYTINHRPQ